VNRNKSRRRIRRNSENPQLALVELRNWCGEMEGAMGALVARLDKGGLAAHGTLSETGRL
jgi:hypothetical protein